MAILCGTDVPSTALRASRHRPRSLERAFFLPGPRNAVNVPARGSDRAGRHGLLLFALHRASASPRACNTQSLWPADSTPESQLVPRPHASSSAVCTGHSQASHRGKSGRAQVRAAGGRLEHEDVAVDAAPDCRRESDLRPEQIATRACYERMACKMQGAVC